MIKGGLFGKLLKQFFIIGLISCFILLGNSFANAGKLQLIGLDTIPSIYDNNYSNSFLKGGAVLSNYLGQGKSVLTFNAGAFLWWAKNGQPYFYDHGFQGFFAQYWSCNELTEDSTGPSGCSSVSLTGDYKGLFKGFFSTVKQGDYAFYDYEQRDIGSSYYDNTVQVCWSSSQLHKSLCFRQHECYNGRGCSAGNYGSLRNSQGLTNLNFSLINRDWIGYAPGQYGYDSSPDGSLDNGGVVISSEQSVLNYFEDYYGWDENICYVGVDNVSDLWGSPVSFEKGAGLSIFEVFNSLYGNTDLDRVYVWLNSWLINYNQWFQNPEDRLYLSNYNSGTNQVDLYYDNLAFPFDNQPVALYFMADNVSTYTNNETNGSEVVSYCNVKINSGTFDEIIDNSTKKNIDSYTEQDNTHKGLNPDGTSKNIDYSEFGSYTSSGVNISFSGDTSIKNTLDKFFNTFDNLFSGFESVSSNRILPQWLVSAFIFVVFFKLLRKKK